MSIEINGEFHKIGTKSNEEKKELIKEFINNAIHYIMMQNMKEYIKIQIKSLVE